MLLVAQVVEGQFCAVLNKCSHMVLPLDGATLEGTTLTCPHHESAFDMCSGANLDWVKRRAGVALPRWVRRLLDRGQTPPPLTVYPVIREGDTLYRVL